MATLQKGKTFTNGETVTPQKLHELVDLGSVTNIQAADIATGAVTSAKLADAAVTTAKLADAAVSDAKLATITTAGKVANSATTAVSANTASAIVARDASGNFSAGTMTGNVVGNADTATRLQTARTINGVAFDGAANITVTAAPTAHTHDDRYYTETEMNSLLAGKQAAGSYAPASGIAPSAITGTAVITTDTRLSDARTPTTHTHDDRYYTEAEIDSRLSGLPVSGHTHDDRYYTETEMNSLLAGKQTSFNLLSEVRLRQQNLASDEGINLFYGYTNPSIFINSFGPTSGGAAFETPYMQFGVNYIVRGSITRNAAGTAVAYNTTSDYRLKTNLEPLTNAVARLLQIPVHRFNWLADPDGEKVDGFLAHEAQAIVPESVTGTKDAEKTEEYKVTPAVKDENGVVVTPAVMGTRTVPVYQGIDQSKLVPLLVASVQELTARIEALEADKKQQLIS